MSYNASAGNWVTLWLFGWEGVCAGTEKGGGCSLMLSGGAEVDWSRFGVMRLIQVTGSDRRNWGQREWGGLGRRTAGVHTPLTPRLFSFASLFCSPHPRLDLTFSPLLNSKYWMRRLKNAIWWMKRRNNWEADLGVTKSIKDFSILLFKFNLLQRNRFFYDRSTSVRILPQFKAE